MNPPINSLKILPREEAEKDFKLGAFFTFPKLEELPTDFRLEGINIKQQYDSDFCAAFSSTLASELQEGVTLSPEWVFAKAKEKAGDVDGFGLTLKDVAKVHSDFGAPEKSEAPYSLENKDSAFLRRIENWPPLEDKASKHKKATYFQVYGPYDWFDDIRATIWRFKNEKKTPFIGVQFGWPITEKFFTEIPTSGFGHAMCVVGFNTINGELYLVVANSAGVTAGENGYHYMSRKVVNYYCDLFGAYIFTDLPQETVLYNLERGIDDRDNWISALFKALQHIIFSPYFTKEEKDVLVVDTIVNKTKEVIKDRVKDMALAIQEYEGFSPGTRAYRNNNPGNIRSAQLIYGAIARDKDNFLIFKTYQNGLDALCTMIRRACEGKSMIYKPTHTIQQYFEIYAPKHENDSLAYAKFVASKLGITIDTPISKLLG